MYSELVTLGILPQPYTVNKSRSTVSIIYSEGVIVGILPQPYIVNGTQLVYWLSHI